MGSETPQTLPSAGPAKSAKGGNPGLSWGPRSRAFGPWTGHKPRPNPGSPLPLLGGTIPGPTPPREKAFLPLSPGVFPGQRVQKNRPTKTGALGIPETPRTPKRAALPTRRPGSPNPPRAGLPSKTKTSGPKGPPWAPGPLFPNPLGPGPRDPQNPFLGYPAPPDSAPALLEFWTRGRAPWLPFPFRSGAPGAQPRVPFRARAFRIGPPTRRRP